MSERARTADGARSPLLERAVGVAILALVAAALLVYVKIFADVTLAGIGHVDLALLTEEPRLSGRAGGVLPIIVSTMVVLAIAVAVAVPISLATALFIIEFLPEDSRWTKALRASMLVLASVPSIAFGFFGAVFFARTLGFGTSLLTGGLTLAVMILPICTFAFEEVFRLLPTGYRYGAYALGASRTRFILQVLIPATATDIITVVLIGLGRALAETAALLFTSGYSDRMPESVLDPGRVLSVHIYDLTMNIPGGNAMAAASAVLLVGIFLAISGFGLLLSRYLSLRERA